MRKITLTLLFLAVLVPTLLVGQTILLTESFETDGNGTRYKTSTAEFSDGGSDFFTRTDGSNISSAYEVTGADGNFYFAAQDIDGEGANAQQTLEINTIDISSFENLSFSLLLAEDDDGNNEDWDNSDFFLIKYQIDGGGYQNLLAIENDGAEFNTAPLIDTDFDGIGDGQELTDVFTSFGNSITGTGNLLDLRITFNLDSGDEDIAIDNLQIIGESVGIDTTSPSLVGTSPVNNATNVALNAVLTATFDEPVQWVSNGEAIIITDDSGSSLESFNENSPNVTFSGNSVIIDPINDFESNRSYSVTISNGALQDASGNVVPLIASSDWTFTTIPAQAPAPFLISEFQPNPDGADPTDVSFEISGSSGESFSGWLIGLESDGFDGTVDRATQVTGTFGGNGLLVVTVPDFENPSFTVVLSSDFSGSVGDDLDVDNDGTVDDPSVFGTVFDALGIPDSAGDASTQYGASLGGQDFAYTGTEPELVFRDASVGDWYAVNDFQNDDVLFDISANTVDPSIFNTDPIVEDTFGVVNPEVGGAAPNSISIAATDAVKVEGDSGTTNFTFTITRVGDTSQTTSVQYDTTGDVDAADFLEGLPNGIINFAADATEEIIAVEVIGDTEPENDETFTITLSNPGNGESLSPSSANGIIQDDDTEVVLTRIHEVQGATDTNLLDGQIVTVEAIVVGDFQDGDSDTTRNLSGFYLQEEDRDTDMDPMTSEGIFVFEDGNFIVDVNVGDRVQVTGTVDEFFGETQMDVVTSIVVISSNNSIPTPAMVSLPSAGVSTAQDGDLQPDLEAYEGMLVNFTDELSITEMFQLDRFNEIKLSQGGRLVQFTQENEPDVVGYAAHLEAIAQRTIVYDDGLSEQNALIGNLDGFGPTFSTDTDIRMGDVITGLSGILSYQWAGDAASGATWRVRATMDGENVFEKNNIRPLVPPSVGGAIKVGSLNVLNYFTTLDEGDNTAGPNDSGPRGADSQEEYDRQLQKLVTAIIQTDADAFGLVELENHPGASPANDGIDPVLGALVGALNSALGTETYEFVDAGLVGDDAIKVGMIYKPALLNVLGFAILDDTFAGSTPPVFDGPDTNRAPLAVTFEEVGTGGVFTAVVTHMKSKGSAGTAGAGDEDANDGAGFANETRLNGVTALVEWLDTDPTLSGDTDFIILGDLNAYAKEDPIVYLENQGYTNLNTGNSYVFDGQQGTLDYALANSTLNAQVTGSGEWNINADEPDAIDYNLDFNKDANIFNGTVPFRTSDHDPVIAGLRLVPLPNVVINEILADPAADLLGDANGDGLRDAVQDEFVELVNLEETEVDISGWVLSDAVGERHIFPEGTLIAPNCGIVIFGGGNPTGSFGNVVVQTASTSALGLNNGGDTVQIQDANGVVVASYTYGGEGGDDTSLTRSPDLIGKEPLVAHSAAEFSGGVLFSPGTRIDGTQFQGCEILDEEAPVITLLGDNPLTLVLGDLYQEPGATAEDNIDGDISELIVIGGDMVDVNTIGTYLVTYNVMDAAGNAAVEVIRSVIVEAPEKLSVFAFVLVDANTNKDIMSLSDGAIIDLSTLPSQKLTIRAEATGDTESVRFSLNGTKYVNKTENLVPYALFGDRNGDYVGERFKAGSYILTATPYSKNFSRGQKGTPLRINFTMTDDGDTNPQQGLEGIRLYPNPADTYFEISFEEKVNVKRISIYNSAGWFIRSYRGKNVKRGDKYVISVRFYWTGTYFVVVEDEYGNSIQRQLMVE